MTKSSSPLIIICSVLTLVGACSWSPVWAEKPKQQDTQTTNRVLEFPEKFSIGKLYVLSRLDLTTQVISTNKAFIRREAQGRVTIPEKGYALLTGSFALGENLQPLQKLKGDDLQIIKLSKLTFKQSDLKYLSALTGLQRIELDSTDVDDKELKTLAKFPNLVYITLARTLVTGKNLADLAPLKKLTDLQLGHNALCDGNLNGVTALTSLKALRIQSCQLRDKDLEPVGKMKNIESLTLHENKLLTDKGIKHLTKMPKLEYLDVGQTAVTINGLKALKNCPLRTIRIDIDQFKKAEIAQLKTTFPKAKILEEITGSHMDPTLFGPLH